MPAGATIVLMPGLLCDAAVWSGQRAALEELAPVTVADFSCMASIETMAEAVIGGSSGPMVLIGHSMGGRVALETVRRVAGRVAGLALLDTGVHPRQDSEVPRRLELVKLAYEKGMAALADEWLPPMVDPRRKDAAALLAPMKAMVMRATPEQHERQIQALINRPDARGLLAGITCPVLLMAGRQDQWSPAARHEEMAALIPGAKLVIVEDSGHMLPMEQPEETAAVLAGWLRAEVMRPGS